jgi:DNA-binding response OmpR family regulator
MIRVLLIDDDLAFRRALAKHLERAGYDVLQASDGDTGIRECQRHAVDVVVVDIFMPRQGGLQTIGGLRREWPGVKIVAMSGVKSAGSLDVEKHALALGADRFVSKPFEAATFLTLVTTLLGEQRTP